MRRLTVVYYSDAPFYGGAEYYLSLLARGLPRDHFDVHMILRPLAALEELRKPLTEAGIPIFEPAEPRPARPDHWISVYRYLLEVHADILHVNLPGPFDGRMGSIAVLGKTAGVKVVTTEHLPMIRGRWRHVAKRLSQPFVDRVITVSDANVDCLETIQSVPRSRIQRIYNGIDVTVYDGDGRAGKAKAALSLAAGEKAIGIIGRLSKQKGHRYFLEAAKRVHAEIPETRFLIVGDGWLQSSLEDLAKDLGLGTAVRFLGYRNDIPTVLSAMDIVAMPSIQEGMPFVILEAMAMGKPIVATAVYGLGEVIRDRETGRLVPPRDSQALAEVLLDLLRSPSSMAQLGQRARALVSEEFSLDRMLQQTANAYTSLMS